MDLSSNSQNRRSRRSPVLLAATIHVAGEPVTVKLRNLSERVILLSPDGRVDRDCVLAALPSLETGAGAAGRASGTLSRRVEDFERETILAELKRNGFHVTNTAKALGLERSHLYKKAEQLGIDLQAARRTADSAPAGE